MKILLSGKRDVIGGVVFVNSKNIKHYMKLLEDSCFDVKVK